MSWLKPSLQHLKPYQAVKKAYRVKLDANESEHYLFQDGVQFNEAMHRYPDNHATELKDKLAQTLGLTPEHCMLGSGSSEVIDHIIKSTVAPGQTILTFSPTFVMYRFYADMHMANYVEVPLEADYTLDVDAFIQAIEDRQPRLIIVCSPNNPTGTILSDEALERIIKTAPGLVILDQAYIEFSNTQRNWLEAFDAYPHLIVTRTFSKAYGLASLRLGYSCAHPRLIEELTVTKTPYNLSSFTQAVGLQALNDYHKMSDFTQGVMRRKETLSDTLKSLGFTVYPSGGNFLFVESPLKDLATRLEDKGILIRSFSFDLPKYRITVGTENDITLLVQALKELKHECME